MGHGTGQGFDILPRDGILTACPVPEYPGTTTGQKGKKSKKITTFEKKIFDNF
jgi:hypothetical protein